jgi:hypothetical protein
VFVPLCEAWPLPPSGCPDLTSFSPAVTGAAVMAASEVLWELSGRQFGSCAVLLRPCRQACAPDWATSSWWWGWPGAWPERPDWWLDAACGRCSGQCGCNTADTLLLPLRATQVTQVIVDGVELAEGSGWVLYDGQRLVRTDGELWPLCQDWTVPVSGVGAWSVTATYGPAVPMIGQFALAELAAEFAAFCVGDQCRLPRYTTAVTRQGVSQQFPTVKDLMDAGMAGLSGLPLVRTFIGTVNPDGLTAGRRIWNPDDYEQPRQPGGWTSW